jgi:hypothetical protein
VPPRHSPEQLEDVTYYIEASAADGKNVSVCKLLAQALTGNSGKEEQGTIGSGTEVARSLTLVTLLQRKKAKSVRAMICPRTSEVGFVRFLAGGVGDSVQMSYS